MYHWRLGKHILFLSSLCRLARLYHTPLILARRRFLASVAPVLRDLLLARILPYHPFNLDSRNAGRCRNAKALRVFNWFTSPPFHDAAMLLVEPTPRIPDLHLLGIRTVLLVPSLVLLSLRKSTLVKGLRVSRPRPPATIYVSCFRLERAGRIDPESPGPDAARF